MSPELTLLDEAVAALPDGRPVSGDYRDGMRAGIEHVVRSLPVAPPVLPGLTRLRKMIGEYDAANNRVPVSSWLAVGEQRSETRVRPFVAPKQAAQ